MRGQADLADRLMPGQDLVWVRDGRKRRDPYADCRLEIKGAVGRPRVDDGEIAHIDMRLSSVRCDRHDQGRVLIRVGDDTAREGLRFERAAGPDREGDVASIGAAHVLRPAEGRDEGQGGTQRDGNGRPGERGVRFPLPGAER